ncbi:MAG: class I SAM-dependent methyltransferase [Candidatus Eremiobacterota bacterium]
MIKKFITEQLKNPDRFPGKFILGPLWNRRNAVLNDATFEHMKLTGNDRVLDIGFGGGYLLGKILKKVTEGYVAGVDISGSMVASCRRKYKTFIEKGKLNIECAMAGSLPYEDEHFTKVTSVNSIFYWTNLFEGIGEIYRVLRKEGLLVLTYTCKNDLDKRGFNLRTYEESEVMSIMETAGFTGIKNIHSLDRYREFIISKGKK